MTYGKTLEFQARRHLLVATNNSVPSALERHPAAHLKPTTSSVEV